MIIVGMTACGKTHYQLKMLERHYMKHFESMILLCPTFEWNKTYRGSTGTTPTSSLSHAIRTTTLTSCWDTSQTCSTA